MLHAQTVYWSYFRRHVVTEESDHHAILVRVMEIAPRTDSEGPRPFQFEEAWTRYDQCDAMVQEAWEAAGSGEACLTVTWNRLSNMTSNM